LFLLVILLIIIVVFAFSKTAAKVQKNCTWQVGNHKILKKATLFQRNSLILLHFSQQKNPHTSYDA